jgi:tetratricopeptide (TPR) repeat protein
MQSKTNGKQTPENSEIIRNLVSESDLNGKAQYAKEHVASKSASSQAQISAQLKTKKKEQNVKTVTSGLSIQKTNKRDPVGEALDTAWLAYESGDYPEAKKSYHEVLNIEDNNRDALLGLGAIAVIEKNKLMARDIYLSLLKQNPRDPIATAALTSLHSDKSSLKSDEKYILSMLQKNPDAPHLNFALGNIYAQQNKWKSAQQHYFNAWQHDKENADYIFNLAVSMDQLSKQQQAINFYKDSLHKSINKQVSFSREAVKKRINELSEL